LEGEIDLVNDDIRVMLVMTNTTADTEDDVNTISAFTTLDEFDGAGYSRQALASQAVNEDAANNRAEFDATDSTFSSIAVGTRQVQAAILFKHVTNDTDSVPLAFIDDGGFPFTANGSDVVSQWNAEGILQLV
jgi:hypothetical protein